jgi:hypothetical protein
VVPFYFLPLLDLLVGMVLHMQRLW